MSTAAAIVSSAPYFPSSFKQLILLKFLVFRKKGLQEVVSTCISRPCLNFTVDLQFAQISQFLNSPQSVSHRTRAKCKVPVQRQRQASPAKSICNAAYGRTMSKELQSLTSVANDASFEIVCRALQRKRQDTLSSSFTIFHDVRSPCLCQCSAQWRCAKLARLLSRSRSSFLLTDRGMNGLICLFSVRRMA